MAKPGMSDETRFLIVIIIFILSIPLLFYVLDRVQSASAPETKVQGKKAHTVVVSDADKKAAPAKTSPVSAVSSTRETIGGGNYSTAHLQLKKVPKGSPQYKELLKAMATANLKGSGVRSVEQTAKTPLKYFDESTPRDRQADALYLYVVQSSEAPHLWFCIQAYAAQPQKLSGFQVKADSKTLTITSPDITKEKIQENSAQFYDAPLTKEGYAVVKGVIAARNATLVYLGTPRPRERKITEKEQQGLNRILDLYEALGGTFTAFTTR